MFRNLPPTDYLEDATLPSGRTSGKTIDVGSKIRYFGDYELLDEIARGGMGVVYKARQINLRSPSYFDFDGDGKSDVVACMLLRPREQKDSAVRICAISGQTGKLLWDDSLPLRFRHSGQSGRLQLHHADAACIPFTRRINGQCVTRLVLNGCLHSFASGGSSELTALKFDPLSPPDFNLPAEPESGDVLLFGIDVSAEIRSTPLLDDFRSSRKSSTRCICANHYRPQP